MPKRLPVPSKSTFMYGSHRPDGSSGRMFLPRTTKARTMTDCGKSALLPPPIRRWSFLKSARGIVAASSSHLYAAFLRSSSASSSFFFLLPNGLNPPFSRSFSAGSSSCSLRGTTRHTNLTLPPSTSSLVLSAKPLLRMMGTVMNGRGRM